MKVKDIMRREEVSLPQNATLRQVIDCFSKNHLEQLPIVDAAKRVVGVITVDQLIELFLPRFHEIIRDFSALEDKGQLGSLFEGSFLGLAEAPDRLILAADLMVSNARWVDQNDSLLHAAASLRAQGYSRLPVIDRDRRFLGKIRQSDIVLALLKGSATRKTAKV